MADPLNPPNDDPTSSAGIQRWVRYLLLGAAPFVAVVLAAIFLGRMLFGTVSNGVGALRNLAAEASGAGNFSVTEDDRL